MRNVMLSTIVAGKTSGMLNQIPRQNYDFVVINAFRPSQSECSRFIFNSHPIFYHPIFYQFIVQSAETHV